MPNETMVHVQEGLFLMWPGKIADRKKSGEGNGASGYWVKSKPSKVFLTAR